MKLLLVHCGSYDGEVFNDARAKARLNPTFKGKKVHVDGLQQIDAVDGYEVALRENPSLKGATSVKGNRHRDLAAQAALRPGLSS